jgi:hypothetical protein
MFKKGDLVSHIQKGSTASSRLIRRCTVTQRRWVEKSKYWQYQLDGVAWTAEHKIMLRTPGKVATGANAPAKYAHGDRVIRGGSLDAEYTVHSIRCLVDTSLKGSWQYRLAVAQDSKEPSTPWLDEHEVSPSPFTMGDHRKSNPRLHMLYVKWAVRHLAIIDRILDEVWGLGNLNMTDVAVAVQTERKKLVESNPAYLDADLIIKHYQSGQSGRPLSDEDNLKA